MKRGEALVCEATSEHCFLDSEGRILNIKRSHPDFYETLAALAEN